MPIEVARDIVSRCDLYPSELVAWAEETCRQAVAAKVEPVGEVAIKNGWFESD